MTVVATTLIKRIRAKQRGWVFTPKDFLDVGTRVAVDQTLSRLVQKGLRLASDMQKVMVVMGAPVAGSYLIIVISMDYNGFNVN